MKITQKEKLLFVISLLLIFISVFSNKIVHAKSVPIDSSSVEMIEGVPIQPSSTLLKWLERNKKTEVGKRPQFRIPVLIQFEDNNHLTLKKASIGSPDLQLINPIQLSLDDSGMGIPLIQKLRERCPKTSNSCGIWLDGYWGSLLENKDQTKEKFSFAVLRVYQLIEFRPKNGEQLKVFIEKK